MLKLKTTRKDMPARENLLINFSSKSTYAEAYRTLRTNIYFSMMEKDLNSLVVTSALQNEGKTNTVANLAYTIAQEGKKVLMVDGDLRKPGLSTRFGVAKATGFSNIVADILGRHVNQGRIQDYGLADLIKLKSLQKRSCILTLNNDINEVELFFLKGNLIDVYWKNRPDSKKLASTLIRENILSDDEAKLALGHQKKSERRLGSILVTMGLVGQKELNKILSIQVMEALRVVADMERGSFQTRPIREEEIPGSDLSLVYFSQLTKEFLTNDVGTSFIKDNIDSNILETEEKNLYLLPCGSIPPNPSELIGSKRTAFLLEQLKTRFDVIIVDSSPIIPATDALMLSPQVDGVVFVVKVGFTNKTIVKDATQQLKKAKANVLGVILNQADISKGLYYKYTQSYYGS